jgi:hypothetical protein
MIDREEMLVDFLDVEIVWHTKLFGKIFYINEINKHLNLDNHFGTKKLREVRQSFWDRRSILRKGKKYCAIL